MLLILVNAIQGLVASEAQNLMKTHVLDEITKHLDEERKKN